MIENGDKFLAIPLIGAGLDRLSWDENRETIKRVFKDTDIVNIENLTHLEQCGDELFCFSCFPLKIENCDGFPIRAIA